METNLSIFVILFALLSLLTVTVQQEEDTPADPDMTTEYPETTTEDDDDEGLPSDDVEEVAFYLYPDPE